MTTQVTNQTASQKTKAPECILPDASDLLIEKVLLDLGRLTVELLGSEYGALQDVLYQAPKSLRQMPTKLQIVDTIIAIIKKSALEKMHNSTSEENHLHMIRLVKEIDSLLNRPLDISPFGRGVICSNLV